MDRVVDIPVVQQRQRQVPMVQIVQKTVNSCQVPSAGEVAEIPVGKTVED